MKAREHAENLIEYFDRISRENSNEVWKKGFITAKEWLGLIDSQNATQQEISAFINVVHANRYRTSGWFDLALGAYHWVKGNGHPVSPPEEFFASERLPGVDFRDVTPAEHAHLLIKYFEQNCLEDPSSAIWPLGLETAREWLKLIESEAPKESEVSTLVEKVFENKRTCLSQGFFDTALGVYAWCKELGFLNLIPDEFRSLFKENRT
ncbi:MAG: hypothetical protein GY832_10250 [Chloroflexi bacterium]|nr:hypothetical protein [Chloroflexota bacterium]